MALPGTRRTSICIEVSMQVRWAATSIAPRPRASAACTCSRPRSRERASSASPRPLHAAAASSTAIPSSSKWRATSASRQRLPRAGKQ